MKKVLLDTPEETPPKRLPTIQAANLLYLLGLVLLVTLGSLAQSINAIWGLLLTEWVLILIPPLLYLKLARLPLRETLRLRWPGGAPALWAVIAGVGASLLALWLGNLLSVLFSFTFPVPPELYPTTPLQALLIFMGLAVSAPVCEEVLFRGVIQRAYERRGPVYAILVVGLLFAAFHLSFLRLLALLPIVLVLGYVAWRAQSLLASMLVHFSYNFIANLVLIAGSLRPDLNLEWAGSLPVALFGLVLLFVAVWLFQRALPPVAMPEVEPERSSWLGRNWPLFVALSVFVLLASFEVVLGRFPEALAVQPPALSGSAVQEPAQWDYRLVNVLDETVGQATCQRTLEARGIALNCQSEQQAFEAELGSSYYSSDAYTSTLQTLWDEDNLQLLQASGERSGQASRLNWRVADSGGDLLLSVQQDSGQDGQDTLALTPQALLSPSWPWRLQGLNFGLAAIYDAKLVFPSRYSEDAQRSLPQTVDTAIVVVTAEPVEVPAGSFLAWRVEVGDQSAWYAIDAPHTLLRYDNGFGVIYELE